MKWFRFYAEALNDPKVQGLSPAMFKGWVNLLCIAANNEGWIPKHPLPVGFQLRIPTAKASNLLRTLVDAGLLEDNETGDLQPHNWNGRQFKSDDVTKRTRESMRRSRQGNVNVHVTAPDTDTDTEEKQRQNRGEAEAERARPFILYEQALGQPVPNRIVAERLIFLEGEFGLECLEHCLKAAALAEAYDIRYVEKILKRHQRDGCEDRPIANSAAPADLAFFENRYAKVKGVAG